MAKRVPLKKRGNGNKNKDIAEFGNYANNNAETR